MIWNGLNRLQPLKYSKEAHIQPLLQPVQPLLQPLLPPLVCGWPVLLVGKLLILLVLVGKLQILLASKLLHHNLVTIMVADMVPTVKLMMVMILVADMMPTVKLMMVLKIMTVATVDTFEGVIGSVGECSR